jgi:hypothetical protein
MFDARHHRGADQLAQSLTGLLPAQPSHAAALAGLLPLRRIDAEETNAHAGNVECISVDHARSPGYVSEGWEREQTQETSQGGAHHRVGLIIALATHFA